jgi:hypothetical protein
MEYFSSDPNADRINRLKGEMSQVVMLFFLFVDLNLMLKLEIHFVSG